MDPRPYHYEFRKPRLSNPTLYNNNNLVNLVTYTKASIIWAHTTKILAI